MKHDLARSIEILSRTPASLNALLANVSEVWTGANYGPRTFSSFDVIGHLIHGERTDWMPRIRWILERGAGEPFPPFDRFAHERESAGTSLDLLLTEFAALRAQSLADLNALRLEERQLDLEGLHPSLGPVTMRQLLATWVVHDLNHVAQIARALAHQYKDEVGAWREFLPILTRA